eukprot:472200_1
MSPSELIVCGSVFSVSFIICSFLLAMHLYDYCKQKWEMQPASKRTVGLSLVSISLFTFSLFLYVVYFTIFVTRGTDVHTLKLLNNLSNFTTLLMALYVWIRRLNDAF